MVERTHTPFHVGHVFEQHPFKDADGAMLELFRNDVTNLLYVGLANISEDEQAGLMKDPARLAMVTSQGGGCLVVITLGKLSFEMPFNSSAIPDDYFSLSDDKRLSVSMGAIDTVTNVVCAAQEFIFPEEISLQFIDITKRQRALGDMSIVDEKNEQLLSELTPETLQEAMVFHPLQSVVAAPTCGCGHHHHHNHAH